MTQSQFTWKDVAKKLIKICKKLCQGGLGQTKKKVTPLSEWAIESKTRL